MRSRTQPRRARARIGRASSVIATAAALVTAVQVADAQPAAADYCFGGISYFSGNWDTSGNCYDEYLAEIVGSVFQSPPDAPAPPPAPSPDVLSFVTPTPEDLVQARKDANNALANPACNAVVTGAVNAELDRRKAEGTDAASVLPSVPAGSAGGPSPQGDYADAARMSARPRRVSGQGALKDGIITVYDTFHNATWGNSQGIFVAPGETVVRPLPDGTTDNFPPTPEVIKAAIILHEVGHLTGANVHDRATFRAPINRAILQTCFGYTIVSPPPPPQPAPRPGPPPCGRPPCPIFVPEQ